MAKFTVIKRLYEEWAVEVEAENATQAIIKAYDCDHEEGESVNGGETVDEAAWEVFEGGIEYPIDSSKNLPRDREAIERHITGDGEYK